MRRFWAVLSSSLVIGLGLITLWSLFPGSWVATAGSVLTQLAVVVAAVAVLIGVLNLLWVHLRRVMRGDPGWPYSIALLVAAVAVLLIAIAQRLGLLGDLDLSNFLFNAVQVSVESALSALIVFFLVYAAGRLLRRRLSWGSLLFTVVLIVVLVGWLQIPALGGFNGVSAWLRSVPASAGARGLLIGVALGVTTAGVRVLLGRDPSYRE